jgi:hypothetical protein
MPNTPVSSFRIFGQDSQVPQVYFLKMAHRKGRNSLMSRILAFPPFSICLVQHYQVLEYLVKIYRFSRYISPKYCNFPPYWTSLSGVGNPRKRDKPSHHAKRDRVTWKVTQKLCRLGLIGFCTNSDGLAGQIVQNYSKIRGVKNQNSLQLFPKILAKHVQTTFL